MNTDIRVGDRFLIEMTVTDPKLDWNGKAMCRVRAPAAAENWIVPHAVLLAGKRLPRAIRVGDRVRHVRAIALYVGVVQWVDSEFALVRWPDGKLLVEAHDDLIVCDEASS